MEELQLLVDKYSRLLLEDLRIQIKDKDSPSQTLVPIKLFQATVQVKWAINLQNLYPGDRR